ncbi:MULTISPECIES: FAD-dependent oxidoreductase [unclassified Microbacterium]|uniref:FAD-dependent oxidoreductase n=1 Tax=unclassified Microbacterium TaxID=2609290 RepID=UPI0018E01A54
MNDSNVSIEDVDADADVLVVGGGPAGVSAAIQAARSGARTVLIEKNGMLGGTTTTAGINFPGLFHAWGEQVIAGIGWEMVLATMELEGAELPDFSRTDLPHWRLQLRVNAPLYAAIQSETVAASGVDLRLHTMLAGLSWRGGGWDAVLAGKEGLQRIRVARVVDCSGDADAVGLAGLTRLRNDAKQPGTMAILLDGYDADALDYDVLNEEYDRAIAEGRILPSDFGAHGRVLEPFMRKKGDNAIHLTGIDGSTSAGRTEAETAGRAALLRIFRFLKPLPGLEGLTVSYGATEVGIRETCTIDGIRRLTGAEYLSGEVWDDAVCFSYYPIDIHRPDGNGIAKTYLAEGRVATIPLSAMIPKENRNIVVAGRCIAGDQEANSAYRVQASAMATGQAAGAAAALAAARGVAIDDVPVDDLRALLRRHGAIVPEPEGAAR